MTTKNKKEFFVELQPCGSFFFGNERTFNTTEVDKYGEEISNYYAISNMIPQQTAILGLLRHSLLALYGKLNSDIADKQRIIGACAFNGIYEESFGLVSSISPLIIVKKEGLNDEKTFKFLLPAPFTKQGEVILEYSSSGSLAMDQTKKEKTPLLENFDPKNFKTDLRWQDQQGKIENEPIFYELTRVGVNKKGKDDAYYKQTFYGLEKGFSFGVWVSFTDDIDESKFDNYIIMPFGADQGLVKIVFHKDNDPANIFEVGQSPTNCLYFTCDAFVDENFFNNIDFAISDFTDFRYIKSKNKNFYQISNKNEEYGDKSNKIRLLKRGSVVYTSKGDELAKYLNDKKAYRNIGYNYYKFI